MVKTWNSSYSVRWCHQMADIPQADWDALAQPLATPFLEWDWLNTLEVSGSVTGQAGWLPQHLTVWRDRTLVAAAPLYVKGHSYGEFVFDQQWAEVATQIGVNYYPKLLGMSPMTPAQGYRFLMAPGEDEEALTERMVAAIGQFCRQHRIAGCHFLYTDPEWQRRMERQGFSRWLHHSYIWQNQGYQSFEDYLGAFNANQRRNIKRERKAVQQAGLEVRAWTGEETPAPLFNLMYDLYSDTCDKFGWWGSKYLTRRFFQQLETTYRDRVVFFAAYPEDNAGTPMALSFCLTKGDRLYGRYWGCRQELDCLHFEACYYRPIAWSIERQIQIFDPGAGGRHKKRRGFPATANYSLHQFYDPRLARIWQLNIGQINDLEQQQIDGINQDLPFKQEPMSLQLES